MALEPHAAGDLEGTFVSFMGWSQTNLMLAMALGFPIGRTLAERYGNYRVYVTAFILFAAASYLCAISDSYLRFLWARILLGFSGGLTLLLGQEILLNEYPARLKVLGVSIWGVLTITPFTLAGSIGGWFADELNWRYFFYLSIILSLIIAGIVGSLLYARGFKYRYRQFDFIGFLLFACTMYGIQTLLNMGNDFDWLNSPFLRKVLLFTLVAFPCFIIWEIDKRRPLVDLKLFAHRNFAIGIICLVVGFFSLQGLISLLTVQIQVLLGYSSTLAGLEFVPILLLSAPAVAIMHILSKRMDARLLACLSLLGLATASYWIGLYDDPASFDQIRWPLLFEGFFLGSFVAPLTAVTLHGLSGAQVLRAAEIVNMLRVTAGGLGISFQNIVIYRRAPYHQLHLSNYFGGRFFPSFDSLGQLSSKLTGIGYNDGMIKAYLGRLIHRASNILAVADAFILGACIFLGLAILVWFAYPTHSPIPPSPKKLGIREAKEVKAP
ncbi:transporter [Candidatus Nitrosoglobus terrae]|uniref:Transporter n=1 Tax=Candidatus Nitrosoglobus terrae TaxID=1630141 RepID=A0A1Q2SKZ6_9GAMM|nr:transporter [Candidatus Nitrosoglobus terrae]